MRPVDPDYAAFSDDRDPGSLAFDSHGTPMLTFEKAYPVGSGRARIGHRL
jgi:hypothetical protein